MLVFLLNLVGFCTLNCRKSVMLKYFVPQLYQLRRGISGGPALEHFYMFHRRGGGCLCIYVQLRMLRMCCLCRECTCTGHCTRNDRVHVCVAVLLCSSVRLSCSMVPFLSYTLARFLFLFLSLSMNICK